MFTVRTDMADELAERLGRENRENIIGLKSENRTEKGIKLSEITISDKRAASRLGKPCGKYISMDLPEEWHKDHEKITSASEALSSCLSSLLPKKGGILITGLGNRYITADSLGPLTCERIIVTRHLLKEERELFPGLREVSCISPGVMGQTGMEAFEITLGACRAAKPSAVIAIDALASSSLSRLGCSIQLSTCGIIPGEGTGRGRFALNEETLGVPVISVGVPTVSDSGARAGFFVSPSDIDILIEKSARVIGRALNQAIHGDLPADYTEQLMA